MPILKMPRILYPLALVSAGLAACEREEPRTYTVPADPPRPALALPDPGAQAQSTDVHWTAPPAWRPLDAMQSFTLAAYEAGTSDAPVSITVTRLTGEGGGALLNINRWRGQVGLEPISDLPDVPMQRIDAGPLVAGIVDLVRPGQPLPDQSDRIVGVLLPRPQENETWFFKMTGPRDAVEAIKPQLITMIESIHIHAPGSDSPHDHSVAPEPRQPVETPR